MVPFADMLNHSEDHNIEFSYQQKSEGFIFDAIKDIPKGTQAFGSYGDKPNMRFFISYGFVNQDNPNE
jgi:hypothetical protein